MWEFVINWMYSSNECGLRIVDYDNMLYPQYESTFDKSIPSSLWLEIQKAAGVKLLTADSLVSDRVKEHWKSIVDGNVPFGFSVTENE